MFADLATSSLQASKAPTVRYPHIPWLPLLFYPALPVVAAVGLMLWQEWPPALTLIVPFVPWVMALIGAAICLMYQRSQTMALMLCVLAAMALWPTLAREAPWALGPALAWWAIAYTINALWAERSSMLLDLALRIGLMALGVAGIALIGKDGLVEVFGTLALQGKLARLGVPVEALVALLATGLTLTLLLLRYGRPQQAGQWLGFVCMAWALPRGAQHPIELALMSAAALTALSISLAHEGFHMAFRDELTGLPGRRALNERLQRMGRVYTLAMADVDHFKAFNDTHGHDVGDQVLRMVASQLRRVPGGGQAYRYGGEEFTLVFPGKTAAESLPHLETVRRAIEAYQMRLRDKPARPKADQLGQRRRGVRGGRNSRPLRVTVSIGLAERGDALRAPDAVIKAADQALYKAKDGGRNQVCAYGARRRGAPA
ncbi:diguanylate cyclase (GGDEF) domain protein [Achromobacter piechaudii ATCC 43553]|uniref:diguanylate cyclase n=1 Tax=Achromobacter piechaudii ATCC 43553 TaxID=742159 RepID=D4XJE7_9BURK|nr:diguanylate cyclase (GGDEF) domain protein [Achromobacter piechaudii ATCC 43553]